MAKKDPTVSTTLKTRPPPVPAAKGQKSMAKSGKSIARSNKSIARSAKSIAKSGKSITRKLGQKAEQPLDPKAEQPLDVEPDQIVDQQIDEKAERRPAAKAPDPTSPSAPTGKVTGAALTDKLAQRRGGTKPARTPPPPPPPPPDPVTDHALIERLIDAVRIAHKDRFEDRDEIGRGGVGAVSVIFDKVLQRRIAMKKLLDAVIEQPLMVRSFVRESQITAQLDHPNLVPVHDIGVDREGRAFFTMKLVEGKTLAHLIESYKEDNHHIDQAYELLVNMLEVLIKVCDALAFAHSRGVIHCDIKAQNIMCGDYGQAYLMDWGFAQLLPTPADPEKAARRVEDPLPKLPAESTSGYVFGTPGYMSPEQAKGLTDQLDERTDVFSLGALLYQVLSGDVPYRAKSPAETVLLAQKWRFPPLEAESVGFYSLRPKELVRIAMRAMAKDPADRYQSVEAFKADLVHYLRGGSHFPSRTFAAGEHVIREGEEADAAFIIAAGECEVYKTVGGKKLILQVLKPGEVFGEMALLTQTPRSASIVALTEVKLMVITREVMDQEMTSMKPWMGAFVRSLASRFRDSQEQRLHSSGEHVVPEDLPEGRRPWWKFW